MARKIKFKVGDRAKFSPELIRTSAWFNHEMCARPGTVIAVKPDNAFAGDFRVRVKWDKGGKSCALASELVREVV